MQQKLLIIISFFAGLQSTRGEIKVATIFGDNMVIQQGINAPIWGTALPGEKITVSFAGFISMAQADSQGKWMIKMPRLEYGGPYNMTISGTETITLKNVMVGEVWFASGQSNMEFTVASVKNARQEIDSANYPSIRFFTVGLNVSNKPLDYAHGEWKPSGPTTAPGFSAVAYFFARNLHLEKHVAVGIIVAAWGGSPAEPFVSAQSLLTHPDFAEKVKALQRQPKDWFDIFHQYEDSMAAFRASDNGVRSGVYKNEYKDANWQNTIYPLTIKRLHLDKNYGNNIWFRKTITLKNVSNDIYKLGLGAINGNATVYVNGKKEGTFQYVNNQQVCVLPAGDVKNGKNVIAIHLVEVWDGGIGSEKDTVQLYDHKGNVVLLDENWKFNPAIEKPIPAYVSSNTTPSTIYNGMIAPVVPYGIKGMLWYQGESNASRAYQYRTLLPLLINDWRINWQEGALPFLIVQLANFNAYQSDTTGSEWAELREAQYMTLKDPNTGMAVTADIGERDDIHPRNKQDVGYRLFLAAQKIAYKEDGLYALPIYENMQIDGSRIVLHFNNEQMLVTKGNEMVKGFTIAGADKIFYKATATVEGGKVTVSCAQVVHPVAVRYGWEQSPEINLYNKNSLPVVPFRTDDWEMITRNNK